MDRTIAIICGVILIGLWSIVFFNRWLPRWFCDKMGWHLAPKLQGFDGCSLTGICPRCGKEILRDSQGNWF